MLYCFPEKVKVSRPFFSLFYSKKLSIETGKQKMAKKVAVVMAAGKGTRMKSELPKVLCEVCGRPMIEYVLDTLESTGIDRILVVIGYRGNLVREMLAHRKELEYCEQLEQKGTGHAVMMTRPSIAHFDGPLLVVAGDCPMIQRESIEAMFAEYEREPVACVMGTAYKDDPTGLGRIVRDADGQFQKIVEEKDATDIERQITEVNMSYYLFRTPDLLGVLDLLKTDNAQGEYYITDAPAVLISQGKRVVALPMLKPIEGLGINNIEELAAVNQAMQEILDAKKSVI
jgi:bifunctional UDP-N-acetylglucosamine pyrophosphorylase/glucosamine-1-phosphate N-acetyltransferase/UDP-N-acetylglucosamine pyrophosphorylase